MTPTEEQIQRDKRKVSEGIAALPMAMPGSPVAASAQSSDATTNSKTEMIGGIPHVKLENPQYPSPLGIAASAMGRTASFIANAPFDNSSRQEANRTGLDASADVEAEQKRQAANPTTPIAAKAAPMGIADMTREQRSKAAGAYGDGVDKLTGVSSSGAQGFDVMKQRFGAYARNDDALAMRNTREDLLGSGIRLERDGKGGMTITNNGTFNPIPEALGSTINMAEGNERMTRANAITQSIIDKQPQGGVGILGDGGIEAANAEKTQRWRQDELLQAGKYGNRAAGDAIQANARVAGDQLHSATTMRGQDVGAGITARGQDIAANTEANRLAMESPLKSAQALGILAQTDSANMIADIQRKALAETDPATRSAMQESLLVAQGRDPNQGRYIRTGGGEQVIDSVTGQKAKLPDQVFDSRTGQIVQAGKRSLSDADFTAIGKKIGQPADALKARYTEFQKQGPATSLKDFNSIDVALSLADGTPPEKISNTIKRLGGNPADYGL